MNLPSPAFSANERRNEMVKNIQARKEVPAGIKTAIFRGRTIRKTIHGNEWWFSVVDVVEVLTDSVDAGAYWRKLKERLKTEGSEVVTNCHGLKLLAPDGNNIDAVRNRLRFNRI